MEDALFSKIIDDAKEYGVKEIMPFLNGEPLLDAKFDKKIAEIIEKIPDARVSFFSNGTLLTKEKADALAVSGIMGANFSINAITNAARKKIMGHELEETVDNILYLQSVNPKLNITVSGLMDTTFWTPEEMQCFIGFWVQRKIKPNLFFNGNWAGKTRKVANVGAGCSRPESILTVLSDGIVALCCYDLLGEVSFGNLRDKSIKEVWESDAMEEYRLKNDMGRRSELKLCSDCSTG
jgi:radical SAM protein with 4Fe4S-binding SPASM domain